MAPTPSCVFKGGLAQCEKSTAVSVPNVAIAVRVVPLYTGGGFLRSNISGSVPALSPNGTSVSMLSSDVTSVGPRGDPAVTSSLGNQVTVVFSIASGVSHVVCNY